MSLRFKCEGDGNSGVYVWFRPGTPNVTKGGRRPIDCTLGKHTGGIYEQARKWTSCPGRRPENESVVIGTNT